MRCAALPNCQMSPTRLDQKLDLLQEALLLARRISRSARVGPQAQAETGQHPQQAAV